MTRMAERSRKTSETEIQVKMNLDGKGRHDIDTGIPFFDHMLTLFTVHGFFDLTVKARGDLDVDYHHTVEDTGLVLGDALRDALGDRKGIARYGHAVTPMDETLTEVTVDLSNRPYLVYNAIQAVDAGFSFNSSLVKEFFRAFSVRGGLNLHINCRYGQNEHHIVESIFKATGRAIDQATFLDNRISHVRSTKGEL